MTAGRIFKSTEVLGGEFASEAPLFSTEAVLGHSVEQGFLMLLTVDVCVDVYFLWQCILTSLFRRPRCCICTPLDRGGATLGRLLWFSHPPIPSHPVVPHLVHHTPNNSVVNHFTSSLLLRLQHLHTTNKPHLGLSPSCCHGYLGT